MSEVMEKATKRWTAVRKSALTLEIIQVKTAVAPPAGGSILPRRKP